MVPDGSVWWELRRTASTFGWPPVFCSGGTSLAETVGLEKSMLKKILHYSDIGVALLMVLVVVMMVIPLPTGLIDVLLAANITLGVVVLLVTFYVKWIRTVWTWSILTCSRRIRCAACSKRRASPSCAAQRRANSIRTSCMPESATGNSI